MTIGIDLSSLQGPHRMRGIGYTLLNLVNNISSADRAKHHFVFFVYPGTDEPLELLQLEGFSYEVRPLKSRQRINKKLPGRLKLLVSAFNQLIEIKDLHLGDSRINKGDLHGVEFFLQTDQSQYLPRKKGVQKGLIIYDIIPYVLEWDYLWSYATARKHYFSRKAALRVGVRRWLYAYKIRVNTHRANVLFSISEHTKHDFVTHLRVPEKKIAVTPLGVNMPSASSHGVKALKRYIQTSWGYVRRDLKIDPHIPFFLYVGGADKRRKLEDLVTAFNRLRAMGHDFKLILAGDSMQGPNNIATEEIQYALKTSSYLDDIYFLGFVDDDTRNWLYGHARAFVFPSRYEGFGLPVLEAMSYGTPIICYDNAATREVAGSLPVYVQDSMSLANAMEEYITTPLSDHEKERRQNVELAKKWSWIKTSTAVLNLITNLPS